MPTKRLWSKEELIIALSLYFQLPFGRLNHGTPEIMELAKLLNRSDNSIAMRLCNFAACDPYILNSGRKGLPAGVNICKPIWDEYVDDKERLYLEAAKIRAKLEKKTIEESLKIESKDFIGHEKEVVIQQRIDQNAFRKMILNNYNNTCAISGINDSRLLIASHIIPWSKRIESRLNPENGICLSALYDKAFDSGLITVRPNDYTVMISKSLKDTLTKESFNGYFKNIENKEIIYPEEHKPNTEFLQYHADNIFIG